MHFFQDVAQIRNVTSPVLTSGRASAGDQGRNGLVALDRDTGEAVVRAPLAAREQRALQNWAALPAAIVPNNTDAPSTPVAQGDPAIISLECRDPGTRATVMLAKGLLVVLHSDGFCNTFPLIAPYGHSLEQRPIPWAKHQ